MRELLLVFNIKATMFLKTAFDLRWQSVLKNLSSLIIFGGFALGVFLLARASTAYLLEQMHIGQFLFHRFLSMLLYVFFITVNLGNLIVCYATLYRSEEVNFLMGVPISHAKIFLIKFVDNFFYSSSTLTLLGLALLLGYGSFFHLPWYFYFITMFAVLVPFMLIAGVLAVMMLMVLMNIAARIGVRWLLAIIVVVYLTAIYIYFTVTNPVMLVQDVMKYYPFVDDYFGYLDPVFVRYLPNHWVSEFLFWSIKGDQARALPYFFILVQVTVGLIIVAGLMAHRYYYSSWLASSDARGMRGPISRWLRLRFMEFGRRGFLGMQTDVILKRDFWLFLREPSQWLHSLLMLLLLLIFLVSMNSFKVKLTQPFLQVVSFLVVFLFNGFLIASVSLRFVFPSVSLESDSFWCVRSAPISLSRLYWQKFMASFLLVFVVGELLSTVSTAMLRDSAVLIEVSAVCTGFMALALTSLNLGSGAYFAVYREKNPIRIASSQGASLTFLVAMIYLGFVVVALAMPLTSYFERLAAYGSASVTSLYLPVVAIALLSVAIFSFSTRIGLTSIRRDY